MRRAALSLLAIATAASTAYAKEPSSKEIAWRFAKAVKAGGDVTLAGTIAVTEQQREKLSRLIGCKFERMPVSGPKRSMFLWTCPGQREGNDYLMDLFFDGRRVVGFDVSTAIRR